MDYSFGKFNLYVGHTLRYEGVGFNHATGWVYRAQGFGASERDDSAACTSKTLM
jgi:hypothetical protein